MNSRIKIFAISFILSLSFWLGVNVFEKNLKDFLFWKEITKNPQIFTAQINLEERIENSKPIRDWKFEEININARAAISVLIDKDGNKKVLFEKNSTEILPIASLTKLMTADIILENYDPNQIIEISKNRVEEKEEFGNLKIGEIFRTQDLLYPLLMESSNDAVIAFAEIIGIEAFVDLMNLEAENLELENTHFINPTGLDIDETFGLINHSTGQDLVKLTSHLLAREPFIWEILATDQFELYSAEGIYHHRVKNNNELLGKIPSIIGGKTGQTQKANGCFLLVLKAPKNQGYLINVILGSSDRFGEMIKLIDWIKLVYNWQYV